MLASGLFWIFFFNGRIKSSYYLHVGAGNKFWKGLGQRAAEREKECGKRVSEWKKKLEKGKMNNKKKEEGSILFP